MSYTVFVPVDPRDSRVRVVLYELYTAMHNRSPWLANKSFVINNIYHDLAIKLKNVLRGLVPLCHIQRRIQAHRLSHNRIIRDRVRPGSSTNGASIFPSKNHA
jgi:hypothetical protein